MLTLLHTFAQKIGLTARRCPSCGVVMHVPQGLLCSACAQDIQPRSGGYCPTCGHMSGREDAPPTQCPECRHTPPPWNRLYFHGRYAGPLREMIIKYKFKNSFGRTRILGDMAYQAFHADSERIPDVIVPVPLHGKRLLWRGFNQSAEIARVLGKRLGRSVLKNGLSRTRNTVPQTRLGHRERQTNIKDAFSADPAKIKGVLVLLVDDVYTTGATLRECTRTLKRAGASGVDVLVLARTQQEPY